MKPTLENVAIEGDHSIKVLHYSCAAFQENHGWHFHPEFELSLILKGHGKRLATVLNVFSQVMWYSSAQISPIAGSVTTQNAEMK